MRTLLILIGINLVSCNQHDTIIKYPEGGYNYPSQVKVKDTSFYFLPIKKLETPGDSMLDAYYSERYFPFFNEPNLSLRPLGKESFRLTYIRELIPEYVITVSEGLITVKKGTRTAIKQTDEIPESERFYLMELLVNFPLQKKNVRRSKSREHDLDSLVAIQPELLNGNYYRGLLEKVYDRYKVLHTYKTLQIPVSRHTYAGLVELINESGYWTLPFEYDCKDIPTDAGDYILEANTHMKYNFVRSVQCDDSNKYQDVIQAICKAAKIWE